MTSKYNSIFGRRKAFIPCIHLLALPGSPLYGGSMQKIYEHAHAEVDLLKHERVDGLIIENFRDKPFYPGRIPAETIASLTAVAHSIKQAVNIPIGINALRNDGESAIAIATAVGASFVRINVHMNAVVSEQGIIQGVSHQTLRLRAALKSDVLIFADVGVKHAAPLADRGLAQETRDLAERGLADAIIVSGDATGLETSVEDIEIVRQNTNLPILIGSGATPGNISCIYDKADGFIVGSYLKKDGKGNNNIEKARVDLFIQSLKKQS